MKKNIILLLLVISSNCFGQSTIDTLNNEDVIKLVRTKLPESIITQKLNSSNVRFDISVNGLIRLKENNVGDNLISLMVKRQIEIDSINAELSKLSNIEYRVTAVDADANLSIRYNDEKGNVFSLGQSGWVYSFKTNKKPFTCLLTVQIYPTKIIKTTVTATILINGKTVASKTGIVKDAEDQQVQFVINN